MKKLSFSIVLLLLCSITYCQNSTDSSLQAKKDTIPYATSVFYRSFIPKMKAPVKKVPIYINDSLVHQLKANELVSFKIIREGKYNIAIDNKGDSDIPVKIKMGQEYYFKCTVEAGLWFGKPTIESISPNEGKKDAGLLKE